VKTLARDVVRDRSATPVTFWSRRPWLFVEQQRKRRDEDEAEDEMPTHDPPDDQIVHGLTSSPPEQVHGDAEPHGFGGTTPHSGARSVPIGERDPHRRIVASHWCSSLPYTQKHTPCAFAHNPDGTERRIAAIVRSPETVRRLQWRRYEFGSKRSDSNRDRRGDRKRKGRDHERLQRIGPPNQQLDVGDGNRPRRTSRVSCQSSEKRAAIRAGGQIMSRQPLRVVAVSDDALRSKLLDALLDDASIHDVVFVEPLANAYKRIRKLAPELIIVLMRFDDETACQLLTMLELDRELLGIPVVTWATGENEGQTGYMVGSPVSTGYNEMAHA
jgi:hypothetical protein